LALGVCDRPAARTDFSKTESEIVPRVFQKNCNPVSASFAMAGTKTRRGSAVLVYRDYRSSLNVPWTWPAKSRHRSRKTVDGWVR
jgi:hypothetical protein